MLYLVWGRESYAEHYIIFVTQKEVEAISVCKEVGDYVTKLPLHGYVSVRGKFEGNIEEAYEFDCGELVYGEDW